MDSKNFSLLTQFTNYCAEHTDERFWQALCNWAKVDKVYIGKYDEDIDEDVIEDTYYFEKKDQ